MGSPNHFLYQNFSLFLATFLLPLFHFIATYLSRLISSSLKTSSNHSVITSQENNLKDSDCNLPELETEAEAEQELDAKKDFKDLKNDGFCETETPSFCFKFEFPTYEEFSRNNGRISYSLNSKSVSSTCEFLPGKGFSCFTQEPEVSNSNVKESKTEQSGGSDDEGSDSDLMKPEAEVVHQKSLDGGVLSEEVSEGIRTTTLKEENGQMGDADSTSYAVSSEAESSSSNLQSVTSFLIDSYRDGFLSDEDFVEKFQVDSLDEDAMDNSSTGHEADDSDDEDSDTFEDLTTLEEAHLQNVDTTFHSKFLSEKDFQEDFDKSKNEEFGGRDERPMHDFEKSVEPNSKNSLAGDSEDSNKLETLWEHQELIEQLKMELKKVRATGLPTILEESESPKIMDDLKPWKIEEKFQQEDPIDELQKLYKSYRERMRKFDILNYQKMYAIGFLQLKDPLQSISSPKTSTPTLTSILSQNFSLLKRKKSQTDPMIKFLRELQSDLEVVYVGQMCLSWEFLHWQYGKALELWESDPRGIHQFNEVAGEFQQFQVLMQRFIEDEPFQGPRVQNYVKSRCVLRNLLQVPVIKEDSSKDRKKARRSEIGDFTITSDMLVEIMEESIRIFWRFVRADKDCTSMIVKGRRGPKVELQDTADSDLLMELQTNLQKKEKKLKDILRSGHCILRKFRRYQEDSSDQVLYFFSQVDMKLVSRVLNMSRITTDQLVWCSNKLSKISFVNRKIHVEPSFLLFPC